MEESRKRIQFQNSGLQIQAIWRIYQEIEKKKPGEFPITEDSPEIPELGFLLDGLCGADSLVAHVSGEALLALVQNGILHFARALNMLLAAGPSVICLSATVRTLHQLLLTEAWATVASTGTYKTPYGLRSRPHPMISLLSHRPEAWYTLIQEVAATFDHRDKKVQVLGLELIRPVVAFLLAEPQVSNTYSDARRGFARVLVSQLRPETIGQRAGAVGGEQLFHTRSKEVIALLLQLLPQSQLVSRAQVIFASELLEEIICAIRLHHPGSEPVDTGLSASALGGSTSFPSSNSSWERNGWSRLCAQVFTMGLELLLECVKAGVDFKSLAVELSSLVGTCSHTAMSHCDINLILLGEILDCPLAFGYPEMVSLVEVAVRAIPAGANILCVASLLKPLLQILATPNVITGAIGESRVKMKAGETLSIIQQRLTTIKGQGKQTSDLPDTFLGSIGLKCVLLRDLCWSLMGKSVRKSSSEHTIPSLETCRAESLGDTADSMPSGTPSRDIRAEEVEANLLQWAKNVKVLLEKQGASKTRISSSRLSRLAAALLLLSPSQTLTREASCLVLQIAGLESAKALDFLPVVLYALGKNPSPESRLVLLETLPDLAVHKYCVSPILKILQALGQCPSTRALSVRLMTRLWRQQDRCFPQLLKVLTDSQDGHEARDVLIAKAGAILEICKLKPEKHGAELLAPLSHILEISSGPQGTAVSVMLVDSLYMLCHAEVMDLLSLWNVLGSRLGQENEVRPLVTARVCRLLSLTPELALDTADYQTFSDDAVRMLWQYTQSSSPSVRRSAFQALACFPSDQSRVSYLPHLATADLQGQAEVAEEERNSSTGQAESQQEKTSNETEVKTTIDQIFPEVPASCYITLLESEICEDEETLKGFQAFLQAMVNNEVTNLPRGVYFASSRKQTTHPTGASVEKIPAFLQQQYDRCKQSGLRAALAAGLLFCYDPPVETSRDGRQFLVRHSKMFMQMFTNLLREVQIQSSDWHLCSQLPDAWSKFMQRLFAAVLAGRRAQLDAQGKQGNLSEVELAEELSLAWMWSREAILDTIKAASIGGPDAQGNSVLSLAGLALCVHNFVADLDPASLEAGEGMSQFMSHDRWMTVACDTVMSLINVEHKPVAGLFGLCRQVSTLDRVPASPACNAMARGAVSLLVPVLMVNPSGRGSTLQQLLADFSSPGSISRANAGSEEATEVSHGPQKAGKRISTDSGPDMALWNGLALGLLLNRLFEEHFSQSTGSKGMLAVWKALSALEKECLSPTALSSSDSVVWNRAGCVLGLTSALCGLCNDGRTEFRVHAVSMLEKLENALLKTPDESKVYEVLWYCVAKVSATAQASNANVQDLISLVWSRLLDTHEQQSQKVGISISLGLVSSTMKKLGNRQVEHTMESIAELWLKNVSEEGKSTEYKLSSLCGLVAMLGSEQTYLKVSEVIKVISNVLTTSNDQDLQHLGAKMLGYLHLALCSDLRSKSTVPQTYGYLPDTSLLRASVDFLLEAGQIGAENVPHNKISAVLKSLMCVGRCLPPLDWASLLLPLMRVNNSETVKTLCLQVAASQMCESPSASTFMTSWLTPPLFNSLSMSSRAALHRCLPQVIRTVSPGILKLYLERSCSPAFTDLTFRLTQAKTPCYGDGRSPQESSTVASSSYFDPQVKTIEYEATLHNVVMSILYGLRDALAIDDPPASVTLHLYEALGSFYQLLPLGDAEHLRGHHVVVLQAMGECLALVPDDILDSILISDFTDATTQLKGSFIRCYLVACGRQPISLLNLMIDGAFNVPGWEQAIAIKFQATCLACMHQGENEDQASCQQWLTELLGHTSSIASGAWPLAESAPAKTEVIQHLISVVACAFLTFTSCDYDDLAICGLDFKLFMKPNRKQTVTDAYLKDNINQEERNYVFCQFDKRLEKISNYLPLSVLALASKVSEPGLSKVIDWLITLTSSDPMGNQEKNILHDALISLRHTQQFRQASVWTKAVRF